MRSFLLVLACTLAINPASTFAKALPFTWANGGGGVGFDSVSGLAVGSNGNTFVTGQFQISAKFGTNVITAASPSFADMFLVRYDRTGNVAWARSAGGSMEDYGTAVAVDAATNVYVTGAFRGTSSFSGSNLVSAGSSDMFLAKYSASGGLIWLRGGGGTGPDAGTSVAIRAAGGCYLCGDFESTASFQGTNITSAGIYDVFVACYDAGGALLWIRSGGGPGEDRSSSLTTDIAGNVIMTGSFSSSTIQFGGVTLTNQNPPAADMFLVKYDNLGNVIWARRAAGSNVDTGQSVASDGLGNLYVSGSSSSTNLTFSGTQVTNRGDSDVFIAKYDGAGTLIWARTSGGSGRDVAGGITVDAAGNSEVIGVFSGISSFGSLLLTNLGAPGTVDIFLAKYDVAGTALWAVRIGGDGDDTASGVGLDFSGYTYFGGDFGSSVVQAGNLVVTNTGNTDTLVGQLDIDLPALTGNLSGRNLVLSWPLYQLGYSLKLATTVGGVSTWLPVTNAPAVVGNNFQVVLPATNSKGFYRLQKP